MMVAIPMRRLPWLSVATAVKKLSVLSLSPHEPYIFFRLYVYVGDITKYITDVFILSKQITVFIVCY